MKRRGKKEGEADEKCAWVSSWRREREKESSPVSHTGIKRDAYVTLLSFWHLFLCFSDSTLLTVSLPYAVLGRKWRLKEKAKQRKRNRFHWDPWFLASSFRSSCNKILGRRRWWVKDFDLSVMLLLLLNSKPNRQGNKREAYLSNTTFNHEGKVK